MEGKVELGNCENKILVEEVQYEIWDSDVVQSSVKEN